MPEELTPQVAAVEDFLQGFRVAINYIFLYSKDHVSFIKSVAELKKKIDLLFGFSKSITVSFSPDYLVVDGATYEKKALHKELAKMFHSRKVKSIQLQEGVTAEELAWLFDTASQPAKDIVKAGGISKILDKAKTPHLLVEDLDYSQFLQDAGEETPEVWKYMLREASAGENLEKIEEFSEHFEAFVSGLKARDLVENKELSENLAKFFTYLKEKDREKFLRCARASLKSILKDKSLSIDTEFDKIRALFSDLDSNDFAQALWDGISSDERFDAYSFQLFSKLVEKERHGEIASKLAENVNQDKTLVLNSRMGKKIQELFFSSEDNPLISGIYRKAIAVVGKDFSKAGGLVLDRKILEDNYHFILLNLLAEEKNDHRLALVAEKILGHWEGIISKPDPEYFKCLKEALEVKKKESVSASGSLAELEKRFLNFIENMAWEEEIPDGFCSLIENLETTTFSSEIYLRMIFDDNKVTPTAMRLFLKLFPDKLEQFREYLKNKHADIETLGKIIDALKAIDSSVSLKLLKYIFSVSNDLIKIEALRAMAVSAEYDKEFIFTILKQDNVFLRREALPVLLKDVSDSRMALEILFSVLDFWGIKNKILLENIGIVEELDLRWARDYLVNLSKKPFFWNAKVRSQAKEVMGRWDARPD